ncbi:unnamed protein product [Sphenostylis stenocarpa]|uniref:Uncharacterized protein n=1 Tax=Sphenostylis stenocarpa TaxID=92480 RepID=A0AA86VT67_9FABA|nr:unnamed protein product [Sphenostylis stenocarpa]
MEKCPQKVMVTSIAVGVFNRVCLEGGEEAAAFILIEKMVSSSAPSFKKGQDSGGAAVLTGCLEEKEKLYTQMRFSNTKDKEICKRRNK